MGCDIHCFVEHKNKETGEWEKVEGKWGTYEGWREDDSSPSYRPVYSGGNYQLFGYLAGVRGEEYDIRSEQRGYPSDAHPDHLKHIDDGDLHSHSYFMLTELLNWNLWWDKEAQEDVKWFYEDVIGQLMLIDEDWDNVRLLFCFDS